MGADGAAVWVAVGLSEVKVLRGGLFAGVVFSQPWLTVLRKDGARAAVPMSPRANEEW